MAVTRVTAAIVVMYLALSACQEKDNPSPRAASAPQPPAQSPNDQVQKCRYLENSSRPDIVAHCLVERFDWSSDAAEKAGLAAFDAQVGENFDAVIDSLRRVESQ
jgi:hypothetical protein